MLNFLSALAPMIPDLVRNIAGNRSINRGNVPTGAERYSLPLLKALADPNSPILRNLAAQEQEGLMGGLQDSIQEQVLANRREMAMGRQPTLFNPERQDEAINYQLTRGGAAMHQQAQQNALQRIIQAVTGVGGYAPAQQDRQGIRMQQGISNAEFGGQSLEKILGAFGIGGQRQTPLTRYSNRSAADTFGPINWNVSR